MQAHTFDGWEYEKFERNGQTYVRRRKRNGSSYQVETKRIEPVEYSEPGHLAYLLEQRAYIKWRYRRAKEKGDNLRVIQLQKELVHIEDQIRKYQGAPEKPAERLLTPDEQTLLAQLTGGKPAEPQLKLITVTEHYDNVIKEWYASDDMRRLLWTLYPDPPRPPAKPERPLSPARKLAFGFFLWLMAMAAVLGLLHLVVNGLIALLALLV